MSGFNLRRRPRISYYEPDDPNLDEYIFCEQCADYVYEYCSIHGPLLVVPDDKVPAKPNVPSFVPRAALTIPKVFLHLAHSVIPGAGLGVFTTLTLPLGVRFGPYKGEKTTKIDSMYCWQIYDGNNKPSHVVDAADANKSNWMRYVNCARHWCEQNLVAFQYQGQLYYRTIKIIPRFTELMVFYGSEFANSLRVDLRKYNAPPEYARKFGAPVLKKPKLDFQKLKADSKCSNVECVETVNSDANVPGTSKNNVVLQEIKDSVKIDINNNANCTKAVVEDKNNNFLETSKDKFFCNDCGEQFDKKDSIELHIKTKHIKYFNFRCSQCVYSASTINSLEKHSKCHDKPRQHVCELCFNRFTDKNELKNHCKSCGLKNNVDNTHSIVTPDLRKECNNKLYNHRRNFVTHLRSQTDDKPYSCSVCNMRFSQKGNLKTHMRIHTGEKPYSCSVCNMRFRHKLTLNHHMRTHTGEKPYSCSVCNMRFSNKGNLIRHMRTHTGEKPYSCSVCNMRFCHKHSLNTHMRTHTGENPYSCSVCNMRFSQKSSLIRHMRIHTGEQQIRHRDSLRIEVASKQAY